MVGARTDRPAGGVPRSPPGPARSAAALTPPPAGSRVTPPAVTLVTRRGLHGSRRRGRGSAGRPVGDTRAHLRAPTAGAGWTGERGGRERVAVCRPAVFGSAVRRQLSIRCPDGYWSAPLSSGTPVLDRAGGDRTKDPLASGHGPAADAGRHGPAATTATLFVRRLQNHRRWQSLSITNRSFCNLRPWDTVCLHFACLICPPPPPPPIPIPAK